MHKLRYKIISVPIIDTIGIDIEGNYQTDTQKDYRVACFHQDHFCSTFFSLIKKIILSVLFVSNFNDLSEESHNSTGVSFKDPSAQKINNVTQIIIGMIIILDGARDVYKEKRNLYRNITDGLLISIGVSELLGGCFSLSDDDTYKKTAFFLSLASSGLFLSKMSFDIFTECANKKTDTQIDETCSKGKVLINSLSFGTQASSFLGLTTPISKKITGSGYFVFGILGQSIGILFYLFGLLTCCYKGSTTDIQKTDSDIRSIEYTIN